MEESTGAFVQELWELLLSAQESPSGIPERLIKEKKEELRKMRVCRFLVNLTIYTLGFPLYSYIILQKERQETDQSKRPNRRRDSEEGMFKPSFDGREDSQMGRNRTNFSRDNRNYGRGDGRRHDRSYESERRDSYGRHLRDRDNGYGRDYQEERPRYRSRSPRRRHRSRSRTPSPPRHGRGMRSPSPPRHGRGMRSPSPHRSRRGMRSPSTENQRQREESPPTPKGQHGFNRTPSPSGPHVGEDYSINTHEDFRRRRARSRTPPPSSPPRSYNDIRSSRQNETSPHSSRSSTPPRSRRERRDRVFTND